MPDAISFPVGREYIFERDAVAFPAYVDGKLVRCVVSEQTIMSDRVTNRSPEEILGIFDHHRPRIEEIARKKILASEPQDEYVIIPSDF